MLCKWRLASQVSLAGEKDPAARTHSTFHGDKPGMRHPPPTGFSSQLSSWQPVFNGACHLSCSFAIFFPPSILIVHVLVFYSGKNKSLCCFFFCTLNSRADVGLESERSSLANFSPSIVAC